MSNNIHLISPTADLDSVQQKLNDWRGNHIGRKRIPDAIWSLILPLLDKYSMSKLSKALGISYEQICSKIRLKNIDNSREESQFVSLPLVPSEQATVGESVKHPITITLNNGSTLQCALTLNDISQLIHGIK